MTEEAQRAQSRPERRRDAGPVLLAATGLAAAVGAASCCALPILLGSLGLGSAWLAAVAWFAAPHRIALLTVATASLVSGAVLFAWRRRAAASAAEGGACRAPATGVLVVLTLGLLTLGAVMVALGYLYA
jgi:mercuric ion transport protein